MPPSSSIPMAIASRPIAGSDRRAGAGDPCAAGDESTLAFAVGHRQTLGMHFNSPWRRLGRALGVKSAGPVVGPRRVEFINTSAERERVVAENNVLARYVRPITSQDGEEGVLRHVVETLGIEQGWCVEFGAWDGIYHANTRDLVHNSGWHA